MNKRILAAILALMLTLCAMPAMAAEFNLDKAPSEDPIGTMAEKITMTIGKLGDSNAKYEPGESVDDNYILRFHEEKLNIDYQNAWTMLTQEAYDQKVALTLAMGDLPDVMVVNELQLRQMVKADMLADLTEALETYACPELRENFASTNGISLKGCTFDGKVMAIPGVSPGADGVSMLYVRADWMEELGLEAPKTMDDVIHISKTFKEKKGGHALLARATPSNLVNLGNNAYGLDPVFALFNSYPEMWIEGADGKLTYGSITPETKQALGYIKGLVDEGVLDKNFVVYDDVQCNEIATSGQAGIFFAPWWYVNWPLADMTKVDANVAWNTYMVPLNDEGKYNTHMMAPTTYYAVVRKGYEHLDAVVKTLNLELLTGSLRIQIPLPTPTSYESWLMGPVTLLQCNYNEKEIKSRNVIQAYNGEKDKGELIAEEIRWFDRYSYVKEHGLHQAILDGMSDGYCFTTGAYTIAEADDNGTLNRVFAATYSKSESMDKKWATLQKLEDELFLQIIVGDKPLDDFDAFVEQWKALGGDEITQELEAMMN